MRRDFPSKSGIVPSVFVPSQLLFFSRVMPISSHKVFEKNCSYWGATGATGGAGGVFGFGGCGGSGAALGGGVVRARFWVFLNAVVCQ